MRSRRSCAPSPACWSLTLDPPADFRRRRGRRPCRPGLSRGRHARRARLPRARGAKGRRRAVGRVSLRGSGQGVVGQGPEDRAPVRRRRQSVDRGQAAGQGGIRARSRAGASRARGRAARRSPARPRPRRRGPERPQDRARQAQRSRRQHYRRPVLLVFLGRAGDPRAGQGDRPGGDRQGPDPGAVGPGDPVRSRTRRLFRRRRGQGAQLLDAGRR